MRRGDYTRWLYRGGHPNRLARLLNRISASLHALGIWPSRLVTLQVLSRHSGKQISFPLVAAEVDGHQYLVAMLGAQTRWVRNVRAAEGHVTLRHGRTEQVTLTEVPPQDRAPILKRYLACAPGARAHIPISRHAPLADFAAIAWRFPVFRITH